MLKEGSFYPALPVAANRLIPCYLCNISLRKGPDVRHMGTKKASPESDAFLCAQSGSFFIGGYDELFWATEQSIVQLVNHNKRVVK